MEKKRILPIILALIVLGATVLSFLVPIMAYAASSDGKATCTKVQVDRKIDKYHYDLTLTFELEGVTFNKVPKKFAVKGFDKKDENHSTLKLNNGSESKNAFYSYSYADIELWDPEAQVLSNPFKFYVRLHDVEYDGEGNTIDLDAKFAVALLKEEGKFDGETEIKTFSTSGYEKYYVDSSELDKVEQDGPNQAKPDAATPYIIVSDYKIDKDQLFAGDRFKLDATMKNTNRRLDIENILMKVTVSDGFSLINSSNTFHFDKLATEDSIKKSLEFMVLPTAQTKTYTITVNFTYEYVYNHVRKQGTCEEVISQAVNQKERFSVSPVTLQPEILPGEETSMDIECINKGKTQIYNVSAEIEGNIKNPNQYEYVGNIAEGGTKTVSFFVANDKPDTTIKGNVIVTYEDEAGNVKTRTVPFATKTMAIDPNEGMNPEIPTDGMVEPGMEGEGEKTPLSNMQKGLIAAGIVVVVFIVYKVVKKRKELKEFEDDDENN